jgi:competence protein ComEA
MWLPSRFTLVRLPTMRGMPNVVLDSDLRDRVAELFRRRRDVWRVALALGAIVLVALFLWGRGATARIAPPAALPPAAATALVAPTPTAVVYVDVAGAVRAPGLYSLPAGARVADALTAARGARPRADLSAINLAEVVADGTKIFVPVRGSDAAPHSTGPAAVPSSAGPPSISLNTADQAALETVPGVGPVTALAIIGFRERIGGFTSVDQLLEVDGIGPATLEEIRPYLHV